MNTLVQDDQKPTTPKTYNPYRQNLYNGIKDLYGNTPDYEQFENLLDNEEDRKALFEQLSADQALEGINEYSQFDELVRDRVHPSAIDDATGKTYKELYDLDNAQPEPVIDAPAFTPAVSPTGEMTDVEWERFDRLMKQELTRKGKNKDIAAFPESTQQGSLVQRELIAREREIEERNLFNANIATRLLAEEQKYTADRDAKAAALESRKKMPKDIAAHAIDMAQKYDVPVDTFLAMMQTENGQFDPNAKSHADAKGLTQMLDSTFKEMGGTDINDWKQQVEYGAKYFKQLLDSANGDEELALAMYNAGPGAVKRYGGVPPFEETQNHIRRVMQRKPEYSEILAESLPSSAPMDSQPIQTAAQSSDTPASSSAVAQPKKLGGVKSDVMDRPTGMPEDEQPRGKVDTREYTNLKTGEKKTYVKAGTDPFLELPEVRIDAFQEGELPKEAIIANELALDFGNNVTEENIREGLKRRYNATDEELSDDVVKSLMESIPVAYENQQKQAWSVLRQQNAAGESQYPIRKRNKEQNLPESVLDFEGAHRVIEEEAKRLQMSPQELSMEIVKAVPRGVSTAVSGTMKGAGIFINSARNMFSGNQEYPTDEEMYRWGAALEEKAEKLFGADEKAKDKFIVQVFEGIGTSLPYMATGLAGGIARGVIGGRVGALVQKVAQAGNYGMAASQGAAENYQEARDRGASPADAFKSILPGAVGGLLDPVTETKQAERLLEKAILGSTSFAKNFLKESAQEGATEVGQSLGTALTGKAIGYNADDIQTIASNALYEGAVGAFSGGLMSSGVSMSKAFRNKIVEMKVKNRLTEGFTEKFPDATDAQVKGLVNETFERFIAMQELREEMGDRPDVAKATDNLPPVDAATEEPAESPAPSIEGEKHVELKHKDGVADVYVDPSDPKSLMLSSINVEKKSVGTGSELLKKVEEYAKSNGLTQLITYPESDRSRNFFAKNGYTALPTDNDVMVKQVPAEEIPAAAKPAQPQEAPKPAEPVQEPASIAVNTPVMAPNGQQATVKAIRGKLATVYFGEDENDTETFPLADLKTLDQERTGGLTIQEAKKPKKSSGEYNSAAAALEAQTAADEEPIEALQKPRVEVEGAIYTPLYPNEVNLEEVTYKLPDFNDEKKDSHQNFIGAQREMWGDVQQYMERLERRIRQYEREMKQLGRGKETKARREELQRLIDQHYTDRDYFREVVEQEMTGAWEPGGELYKKAIEEAEKRGVKFNDDELDFIDALIANYSDERPNIEKTWDMSQKEIFDMTVQEFTGHRDHEELLQRFYKELAGTGYTISQEGAGSNKLVIMPYPLPKDKKGLFIHKPVHTITIDKDDKWHDKANMEAYRWIDERTGRQIAKLFAQLKGEKTEAAPEQKQEPAKETASRPDDRGTKYEKLDGGGYDEGHPWYYRRGGKITPATELGGRDGDSSIVLGRKETVEDVVKNLRSDVEEYEEYRSEGFENLTGSELENAAEGISLNYAHITYAVQKLLNAGKSLEWIVEQYADLVKGSKPTSAKKAVVEAVKKEEPKAEKPRPTVGSKYSLTQTLTGKKGKPKTFTDIVTITGVDDKFVSYDMKDGSGSINTQTFLRMLESGDAAPVEGVDELVPELSALEEKNQAFILDWVKQNNNVDTETTEWKDGDVVRVAVVKMVDGKRVGYRTSFKKIKGDVRGPERFAESFIDQVNKANEIITEADLAKAQAVLDKYPRVKLADGVTLANLLSTPFAGARKRANRRMLILAGIPGAGKSVTITPEQRAGSVEVNSDLVKQFLMPETSDEQLNSERHSVSSELSKLILGKALDDGYDILYDSVLREHSRAKNIIDRVLEGGGIVNISYTFVDAVTSVVRTRVREELDPEHRKVPYQYIVDAWNSSVPVLLELLKEYRNNENVNIDIFGNNVDGMVSKTLVYSNVGTEEKIHDQLFDSLIKTPYDKVGRNYERTGETRITVDELRAREDEIALRARQIIAAHSPNSAQSAGQGIPSETESDTPGVPRKGNGSPLEVSNLRLDSTKKLPAGQNRLLDFYRGTLTEYTGELVRLDDDMADNEIVGDASKGTRKYVFLQHAKSVLKEIADLLGMKDVDLSINPSGTAGSGDVYLEMFPDENSTQGIYIHVGESFAKGWGGSVSPQRIGYYWRTLTRKESLAQFKGKKGQRPRTETGGNNWDLNYDDTTATIAEKMKQEYARFSGDTLDTPKLDKALTPAAPKKSPKGKLVENLTQEQPTAKPLKEYTSEELRMMSLADLVTLAKENGIRFKQTPRWYDAFKSVNVAMMKSKGMVVVETIKSPGVALLEFNVGDDVAFESPNGNRQQGVVSKKEDNYLQVEVPTGVPGMVNYYTADPRRTLKLNLPEEQPRFIKSGKRSTFIDTKTGGEYRIDSDSSFGISTTILDGIGKGGIKGFKYAEFPELEPIVKQLIEESVDELLKPKAAAEPQPQEETDKLAEVLRKDEEGEYSDREYIEEVEQAIDDNHPKYGEVMAAIEKFQDDMQEDMEEWGLRGDVDEYSEDAANAIRALLKPAAPKLETKQDIIQEIKKPEPAAKPTLQQKADAVDDEIDALWDEFDQLAKKDLGKLSMNPVSPELLALGTKIVGAYTRKGVYSFAAIVQGAYNKLGDSVRDYFEAIKAAYGAYYFTAPKEVRSKMDSVDFVSESVYDSIVSQPKDGDNAETKTDGPAPDGSGGSDGYSDGGVVPGKRSGKTGRKGTGGNSPDAQGGTGGTVSPNAEQGEGNQGAGGGDVGGTAKPDTAGSNDGAAGGNVPDPVGTDGGGKRGGNAGGGTAGDGGGVLGGGQTEAQRPDGGQRNVRNFTITPDTVLGVPRIATNLKALEILDALESSGREATEEEKLILVQYTGWGAFPQVFDDERAADYAEYLKNPDDWYSDKESMVAWGKQYYKSYQFLKRTLDADEFNRAKESTLNAHYTSREVITGIWNIVSHLGFTGGVVVEPSAGIGNFIGLMPENIKNGSLISAVEIDKVTGKILGYLYPDVKLQITGYQNAEFGDLTRSRNPHVNVADLVITNVPFAGEGVHFEVNNERSYGSFNPTINAKGLPLHDQFIIRSLDLLKPGGLGVFITSKGSMDKKGTFGREEMLKRADLIGAIRLPHTAFEKNAKTSVTTDLLIFRKRSDTPLPITTSFRSVIDHRLVKDAEGNDAMIQVNEYFDRNPEMMLGEMGLSKMIDEDGRKLDDGGLYGGKNTVLRPIKGETIEQGLARLLPKFPANIFGASGKILEGNRLAGADIKSGALVLGENGELLQNVAGRLEEPDFLFVEEEFENKEGKYTAFVDAKGKPTADKTQAQRHKQADSRKRKALHFIKIRDLAKKLTALEISLDSTEEEIEETRKALNEAYDAFKTEFTTKATKKYQPVNGGEPMTAVAFNESGMGFLDDDPESPIVLALESAKDVKYKEVDKKTGVEVVRSDTFYFKAPIFFARQSVPAVMPETAENMEDAIVISMNYKNRLDSNYIASLLNRTTEDVEKELIESGKAFRNPETEAIETKEEYLSGFVRKKLRIAESFAKTSPEYQRNVEALLAAVPPRQPISQIRVQLGVDFVPVNIYEQFAKEMFDVDMKLVYSNKTYFLNGAVGNKENTKNMVTHGVYSPKTEARGYGSEIFLDALNSSNHHVTYQERDQDGNIRTAEDGVATKQAIAKREAFGNAFNAWLQSKPELATVVEGIYNETKNGVTERQYYMPNWKSYPGMATRFSPYPHQRRGTARALQNPTGLFHFAGAGKTFTAAMIAMEARRLGIARKVVIVVQNSTVRQFAGQFKDLYPGANILVPSERQRSKKHRNKTVAKIALNDFDAIILPKSFFNMLPDDERRINAYTEQEIDRLMDVGLAQLESQQDIDNFTFAAEGGKAFTRNLPKGVKNIIRKINALRKRIEKRTDTRKDDMLTWEQLGVDFLIVDEAHDYKKMGLETNEEDVKGIDPAQNDISFGMVMKTRHIFEKTNNRNVVFMTGTPITNTLAEAWTMMRYLRPDVLKEAGIETFDEFRGAFGSIETKYEQSMVNTWKAQTRFRGITNAPEFVQLFKIMADVILDEDANLPNMPVMTNDNKPERIVLKQTPALYRFLEHLRVVMAHFDQMSGKDRMMNSHIPITTFTLAKKAAIDLRLVDPDNPDYQSSKTNECVKNVLDIYKNEGGKYYAPSMMATQLIFCDNRYSPEIFKPGDKVKITEDSTREIKDASGEVINVMVTKVVKNGLVTSDIFENEVTTETGRTVKRKFVHVQFLDKKGEVAGEDDVEVSELRYQDPKDSRAFDLYLDIREKLIKGGMDPDEVVILDKQNDKAKGELFQKAKDGEVRVIIGHTEKLGIGVNVQHRLFAIHHLDAPTMPYLLEQRIKRMIRQENMFGTPEYFTPVRCLLYGVEKSLDAKAYDMLMTKQKGTDQILRGKVTTRFQEDSAGELSMTTDEMQAELTGDPRALEKIALERKVIDLLADRSSFKGEQNHAYESVRRGKDVLIPDLQRQKEMAIPRIELFQKYLPDGKIHSVTIKGETFTDVLTEEEAEKTTKDAKKRYVKFVEKNKETGAAMLSEEAFIEKALETAREDKRSEVNTKITQHLRDLFYESLDDLKKTSEAKTWSAQVSKIIVNGGMAVNIQPELHLSMSDQNPNLYYMFVRKGWETKNFRLKDGKTVEMVEHDPENPAHTYRPVSTLIVDVPTNATSDRVTLRGRQAYNAATMLSTLRLFSDMNERPESIDARIAELERQIAEFEKVLERKYDKDELIAENQKRLEELTEELAKAGKKQFIYQRTFEDFLSDFVDLTPKEREQEFAAYKALVRDAFNNKQYVADVAEQVMTLEEAEAILKGAKLDVDMAQFEKDVNDQIELNLINRDRQHIGIIEEQREIVQIIRDNMGQDTSTVSTIIENHLESRGVPQTPNEYLKELGLRQSNNPVQLLIDAVRRYDAGEMVIAKGGKKYDPVAGLPPERNENRFFKMSYGDYVPITKDENPETITLAALPDEDFFISEDSQSGDFVVTAGRSGSRVAAGPTREEAIEAAEKKARENDVVKLIDQAVERQGLSPRWEKPALSLRDLRQMKRYGSSKAVVIQAVQPYVDELKNFIGDVVVVQSVRDLPDDIKQYNPGLARGVAWKNADGQPAVWLIADNLESPKDAVRTLMHEVLGHHGLRAVLPAAEYRKLMDEVFTAHRSAIMSEPWVTQYREMEPDSYDPLTVRGRQTLAEEWIARTFAEQRVEPTLWDRIVAFVSRALRAMNFSVGFTKAEIREMVDHAYRYLRGDAGGFTGPEGAIAYVQARRAEGLPMFAKALDSLIYLTKNGNPFSPAFNLWFRGSKVVNADGTPKVLYHGGAPGVNKFNVPLFLSPYEKVSRSYIKARTTGDGKLYSVYASIKNPAKNDAVELAAVETGVFDGTEYDPKLEHWPTFVFLTPTMVGEDKVEKVIKNLRDKGYDGAWIDGDLALEDSFTEYDSVVVFSSEQVKSATDNDGGYDPNNPDIRFARNPLFKAAAIKIGSRVYSGRAGMMHSDVAMEMLQDEEYEAYVDWVNDGLPEYVSDGFITMDGRYVTREEAAAIVNEPRAWNGGAETGFLRETGRMEGFDENGRRIQDGPRFSRALKQTDTPAFKKWFGESKIVNPDGSPKVVYHGSKVKKISSFNNDNRGGIIYFTEDESYARDYATEAGEVYPVFIRLTNPARFTDKKVIKILSELSGEPASQIKESFMDGYDPYEYFENAGVVAALKKAGYDGIEFDEEGQTSVGVFSPTQIKSATGNRGTFSPTNADIRFSLSPNPSPFYEEFQESTIFNSSAVRQQYKEKAIRYFQDYLYPLKKLQDEVLKSGKRIKDSENAYQKEELSYGRTEVALQQFEKNFIEPIRKKMKEIKRAKITLDEVREFMYAKHAIERNKFFRAQYKNAIKELQDRLNQNPLSPNAARWQEDLNRYMYGSGMEDQEATAILSAAQTRGIETLLNELADLFYKINAFDLENRLKAGLISQEYYDELTKRYKYYMPLRGFERDDEDGSVERTGRGYDVRGAEYKGALGRGSMAGDILSYAIAQAQGGIVRSGKNDVMKAFFKFVTANPDPERYKVLRVYFVQETEFETGLPLVDSQGRTIYRATFSRPKQVDFIEGRAKYHLDEVNDALHDFDKSALAADNVIGVKIDGAPKYIRVEDPQLAQALKKLNMLQVGTLLNTVRAVTDVVRKATTQYNPIFVARNFLRDLQTALFNVNAKIDSRASAGIMANIFPAMGGLRRALKGDTSTMWATISQDFLNNGGATGYWDTKTMDKRTADLVKEFERIDSGSMTHIPISAIKSAGAYIDYLNRIVELGVRVSTYDYLKNKLGWSSERAASFAKNLTVNFNRKGEKSNWINSLYMFFNANIQGTVRMFSALTSKDKRERSRAMVQATLLVGASMAYNAVIRGLFGRDDDDEEWMMDKIAAWTRHHNVLFPMMDGTYIKAPLAYGYNIFWATGDVLAQAVQSDEKKVPHAIMDLLITSVDAFNPLGASDSKTVFGVLAKMATPTALRPVTEMALNEDFMGRRIVPIGNPFVDQDRKELTYESTPETYRTVAGGINAVLEPFNSSISPEDVRYLYEFYTAGVGRTVNDVLSTSYAVFDADVDVTRERLPFVNTFTGKIGTYYDKQKFYENRSSVDRAFTEIENKMESEGTDAAKAKAQELRPELEMSPRLTDVRSIVRILNEEVENVKKEKGADSQEYKDVKKRAEELKMKQYKRFNKELKGKRKLLNDLKKQ